MTKSSHLVTLVDSIELTWMHSKCGSKSRDIKNAFFSYPPSILPSCCKNCKTLNYFANAKTRARSYKEILRRNLRYAGSEFSDWLKNLE